MAGSAFKSSHDFQKIGLGRFRRQFDLAGEEPKLLGSPIFVPDVGDRRRIVADQHDGQSRRDSVFLQTRDLLPSLLVDSLRNSFAIDQIHSMPVFCFLCWRLSRRRRRSDSRGTQDPQARGSAWAPLTAATRCGTFPACRFVRRYERRSSPAAPASRFAGKRS